MKTKILLGLLFFVQLSSSFGWAMNSDLETYNREEVRSRIRARASEFKECYISTKANDKKITGTLTVKFEIAEQGRVAQIGADETSSTMKDMTLRRCLFDKISGVQFPEPPKGSRATVTYPFSFKQ